MKQLLILIITIFVLLVSIGCTPESPNIETITPPQNTITDEAAPPVTQKETSSSVTEEQPTITDDSTPAEDETTLPLPTIEEVEEKETAATEDTSTIIFTASPIDVENIVSIVVLGNLNLTCPHKGYHSLS